MIKALISNNRITSLVIGLLLVAGLGALQTLPRLEDPYIVNRFATLVTHFPGASSARVEQLVTDVLENELKQNEDIKLITSTSRSGISIIALELKGKVTETDIVWAKVRNLVIDSQYLLPFKARNSRLNDQVNYANTLILGMTWKNANKEQVVILHRYAKELEQKLRLVSGTDFAEIKGAPEEEILVELIGHKVSQLGLSIAEIAQKINQTDVKVSAGELNNQYIKAQIEVAGELDSLTRIAQIPLKVNANGQVDRLADVANIKRQAKTPQDAIAIINGQQGIVISARMNESKRIDLWMQDIESLLEDFQSQLPANIEVNWLFEQQTYTNERIGDLVESLFIGFILILLVLLFTLGYRSALIVAASLPLTVLFSLGCMKFVGLPIHQMSITGLVIALGIMVDNAIVITDGINQRRQSGASVFQAVSSTVKHFWLPLAGSTLTTILAFCPIIMMPGATGEFVGALAISVIFALIGSYLISHSLIAGLAGRYSLSRSQKSTWFYSGIQTPKLSQYFKSTLSFCLKRPVMTACFIGFFPILGFISISKMTEQFFPPSDRNMFQIEVYFPLKNSLANTQIAIENINNELSNHLEIERIDWMLGENFPSFYYNLVARNQGIANYAQAMVKTSDYKAANKLIPHLQKSLTEKFPNSQILVRKLEQGPPFNAPIELRVFGSNIETLAMIGDRLRLILANEPRVVQTRCSIEKGTPKLQFQIDENKALRSGFTLTAIAEQIQMSTMGVIAASLLEQSENIPIRVKLSQHEQDQQNKISQINLVSPHLLNVPLATISTMQMMPNIGMISRRNGERVNTIEAYLKTDILPADVLAKIKPLIAKLDLPSGYRIEIGGENAKRNQAVNDLLSNLLVILSLLVATIVIALNSYRLTLIIVLSALQSAGLGTLAVFIFGYPFGFTVIIGLLGLMGLAINAAIVILAELTESQAQTKEAIVKSVSRCGRHISSTTITTVGGFFPLIIAGGGFWPPFALTIAGGTLLTSILSLFWVPVMYRLLIKKKQPS